MKSIFSLIFWNFELDVQQYFRYYQRGAIIIYIDIWKAYSDKSYIERQNLASDHLSVILYNFLTWI